MLYTVSACSLDGDVRNIGMCTVCQPADPDRTCKHGNPKLCVSARLCVCAYVWCVCASADVCVLISEGATFLLSSCLLSLGASLCTLLRVSGWCVLCLGLMEHCWYTATHCMTLQ